MDVLDILFNEANVVKRSVVEPGQDDFDILKNYAGTSFMCYEVEPVASRLSLTYRFAPNTSGNSLDLKMLYPFYYDSGYDTSHPDKTGYCVLGEQMNRQPQLKVQYIDVDTDGTARIANTFSVPFDTFDVNRQVDTDYIATHESSLLPTQTLGRGTDAELIPDYMTIKDLAQGAALRASLDPDKADLMARLTSGNLKQSKFFYVLNEITLEPVDVTYVVQKQGNTLATQLRQWEGINERYGEEDAIHSYDFELGTLFDSRSSFDKATLAEADVRFPMSEWMTSNYFLWLNHHSNPLTVDSRRAMLNQEPFDNLYSPHGNVYTTHKLHGTNYATVTEVLHKILSDYHSKKRMIVDGSLVGKNEVLTPLQYIPFKWRDYVEELGSEDFRFLRPTQALTTLGLDIPTTVSAQENVRTSELDASLLFKSFGPGYDEGYN